MGDVQFEEVHLLVDIPQRGRQLIPGSGRVVAPHGRVFLSVTIGMGVAEGDLRNVFHSEARFEKQFTAVDVAFVVEWHHPAVSCQGRVAT